MQRVLCLFIAFGALIAAAPAVAEKSGGVLKVQHWDSPASMSILEEATYSTVVPVMEVMNNLVIYDQHIAQNSLNTIHPDLAESWSWSEDGTELTFKLRSGVKWHDGKPFTAKDVKCTFDLLQGKREDKLRINPRDRPQGDSAGRLGQREVEVGMHALCVAYRRQRRCL